jgi:hypothetical protein
MPIHHSPTNPSTRVARPAGLALVAATFLAAPTSAIGAQIPGLPILQNAWAAPGVVVALDAGSGSGGSTFAGAASWAPAGGRFDISAGAGVHDRSGVGSAGAYGARIATPFGGAASSFGFAAFAGIGGAAAKTVRDTLLCPPGPIGSSCAITVVDSTSSTTEIPVGASVAWRKTIGATHGISIYATPAYVWLTGGTKNGGLVRVALGADFGITQSLGVTIGADAGGKRPNALGGPSGTQFGAALSYALGRR